MNLSDHVTWFDYGVIGSYVLGMLGIGYYIYRRTPNFEEFLVAGRTMTTPILICTLASTYYGLDVLFGTSELAFNDGVVAFFGYSQMSLGIYIFAAFALARRLRREDFKSLPEILERNYGKASGTFGALASIFYSIPALSLFALGRMCQVMFGIDARLGGALLGGIALLYTLWGGLWAVAITDTVQFVLMCVTLAVAIPILMNHVGGFDAVAQMAPEGFFSPMGGLPIWLVMAYAASGISILVDPGFYQRIFAARDYRQARNAMLVSLIVWGAYDWLVTAGGMLAAEAVRAGVLPGDLHPNDALLTAVTFALPVGLTGLFLAGVLAAAMSTIDSYTLVSGANVVYDLYRPLLRPQTSDENLVRYTKWGILLSWVAGYALAFAFERLMSLWVFTASVLTSTVLVPIFATLYSKRPKKALAGVLSCAFGLVSVIAFYLVVYRLGEADDTYGTYIWTFSFAGVSFRVWQEYALFFTLPMSGVGYLLGSRFGRRVHRTAEAAP